MADAMSYRVADERLREIIENTYCWMDEGPILAAELLAARERMAELERDFDLTRDDLATARQRIKDLERGLVEKMDEALKQLPPLRDQRWMLVMKHKETP